MWKSYHLFFHDTTKHDDIILEVSNLLKNKELIYFFIRYWEGGPHLRVRIKDPKEDEKLALKAILDKYYNSDFKLTKELYYKNNKLDGEFIKLEELPWFEDNCVEEIVYIPETERYGGERWISYAEVNFCKSTDFVIEVLKMKSTLTEKFLILLLSYLFILSKIRVENNDFDAVLFLDNCINYWDKNYGVQHNDFYTKIINTYTLQLKNLPVNTIKSLVTESSLKKLIYFTNNLQEVSKGIYLDKGMKMSRSVLFSQFHMTANRLGISIEFECCLYKVLKGIFISEEIKYDI